MSDVSDLWIAIEFTRSNRCAKRPAGMESYVRGRCARRSDGVRCLNSDSRCGEADHDAARRGLPAQEEASLSGRRPNTQALITAGDHRPHDGTYVAVSP